MSNKLHRQYEGMDVQSMLLNLRKLYGEQSWITKYEISKQLFYTKMSEATSVQIHILNMIDLITQLDQLDFAMNGELNQDLILQSFSEPFS